MMSLASMDQMADEAAERAREEGMEPRVFTRSDSDPRFFRALVREVPFLGPLVPEGWERVNLGEEHGKRAGLYHGDAEGFGAWFVDSSGFGSPGEPALTLDQFRGVLEVGVGYGIVQAGQFQVKVGAFRRV